MKIMDIIATGPLIIKIIVGALFFVWFFEIFLIPFKLNIWINNQKRTNTLLEQIIGNTAVNKELSETFKKIIPILLNVSVREDRKGKNV